MMKLLTIISLIGLVSVSADFKVDASHTKTKDVTIKGFIHTKPQGENQAEMKFKVGETILLKGMGGGFAHTILIDVIKINSIDKSGFLGWWSSPSVTSGKIAKGGKEGKIDGKKSLANHLNTDKKGLSWYQNRAWDSSPVIIWVEKLGGNTFLFKSIGCTETTIFKSQDFHINLVLVVLVRLMSIYSNILKVLIEELIICWNMMIMINMTVMNKV